MGDVVNIDSVRNKTSQAAKDTLKRTLELMNDKELLKLSGSYYSSYVSFALFGLRCARLELEQMPECRAVAGERTVIINAVRTELEALIKLGEVNKND